MDPDFESVNRVFNDITVDEGKTPVREITLTHDNSVVLIKFCVKFQFGIELVLL